MRPAPSARIIGTLDTAPGPTQSLVPSQENSGPASNQHLRQFRAQPRPSPLPERARNYRGPIGCAVRPRSCLRTKPAWAAPGSETEAGAADD